MPQRGHRGGGADDPLQAVGTRGVGAVLPDFPAEPGGLERALDHRGNLVQIERLVGEVIGPELHRLDRGFDAGIRGQEDHQRVLIQFLDLAEDRDPVGVGQPIVEQDQIDAFGEPLHGRLTGVGLEHVVSLGLEAFGQRPADQGFIIDDEHGSVWHGAESETVCGSAVPGHQCTGNADGQAAVFGLILH